MLCVPECTYEKLIELLCDSEIHKAAAKIHALLSHRESFSDELNPSMWWTEDYNSAKRELQQLMNKYY